MAIGSQKELPLFDSAFLAGKERTDGTGNELAARFANDFPSYSYLLRHLFPWLSLIKFVLAKVGCLINLVAGQNQEGQINSSKGPFKS